MFWEPTASIETLRQRSALLAKIRRFFADRQVLEVETPILSVAGNTDPHIDSIQTQMLPGAYRAETGYLHTSPEFFMKRLLAAGSGDIYQICKVFRDGEAGRWHNPEFTMLEWYRVNWGYHQLMDEVESLAVALEPSLTGKTQRISYRQAFLRYAGMDPFIATDSELQTRAAELLPLPDTELGRDDYLDLILTTAVEPELGRDGLCFVFDYPASQASLAKLKQEGDIQLAERFELYWQGVELANGFTELTSANEQKQRFLAENKQRSAAGKSPVTIDENFVAALAAGMPECAGVALGLDRFCALASGADSLGATVSFLSANV